MNKEKDLNRACIIACCVMLAFVVMIILANIVGLIIFISTLISIGFYIKADIEKERKQKAREQLSKQFKTCMEIVKHY